MPVKLACRSIRGIFNFGGSSFFSRVLTSMPQVSKHRKRKSSKSANQILEAGNDGGSRKTSKQDAGTQTTKDVSAKSPPHPEHLDLPWRLALLELEKEEPAHSATPHDLWHMSQATMERPHARSSKRSGSTKFECSSSLSGAGGNVGKNMAKKKLQNSDHTSRF